MKFRLFLYDLTWLDGLVFTREAVAQRRRGGARANFLHVATRGIGDGLLYKVFHDGCCKVNRNFAVQIVMYLTLCNCMICGYKIGQIVISPFHSSNFQSSMVCTVFFSLYWKLSAPASMQARTLCRIGTSARSPDLLLLQGVLLLIQSGDQRPHGGRGAPHSSARHTGRSL